MNGKRRPMVKNITQSFSEFKKKKLYISVIDDDPIIRTMLSNILPSIPFDHYVVDIEVFDNGPLFFRSNRLHESGEHFLIVDGVMPMMDGLEILQKVKEKKHNQNMIVFMLSSRKKESDIAIALKYGADDYMTKPFEITELQARIERLVYRMK
jgi:two-component system, cell cycle response regulator